MIKVATAECFTHGLIAREIHALSQGYEAEFGFKYFNEVNSFKTSNNQSKLSENAPELDISVVCGVFIPTVSGLKNILKIDAPTPYKIIKGVKVYDENYDKQVAVLMAKAVKNITEADIGIGTTAGIGRGGIALSTKGFTIVTTSGFYADLTSPCSSQLLKRQTEGVHKALNIFMAVLNDDLGRIMEYEDVLLQMNEEDK